MLTNRDYTNMSWNRSTIATIRNIDRKTGDKYFTHIFFIKSIMETSMQNIKKEDCIDDNSK